MYRSKGILKNRTQIEEWIENKAIRWRWQHSRHRDDSDSEEEEEESNSDEGGAGEDNEGEGIQEEQEDSFKAFCLPVRSRLET